MALPDAHRHDARSPHGRFLQEPVQSPGLVVPSRVLRPAVLGLRRAALFLHIFVLAPACDIVAGANLGTPA